ncbi:hypothetical protein ABLI39_05185 [Pseudarthrobacter sp. B907]|uniref:hypothetical protein n=1 Tax=Pseudarthrobacter sp. B907 TaxID=3158261 RepID=UPI0032DA7601
MTITDDEPNRTLIIEPSPDGHRFYYVNLLIAGALRRGDDVTLLTSAASLDRPEFRLYIKKWIGEIKVATAEKFAVQDVARHARNFSADLTVVPDGDAFTFRLARTRRWRGPGAVSTLIMRESVPSSGLIGMRFAKKQLKALLIRRANRMRNVRATVLKSALWRASSSDVPAVADPVSVQTDRLAIEAVRSQLMLDPGTYWFGVIGVISARKNPVIVLDALAACPPISLGVVIAGQIDQQILDEVLDAAARARSAGHRVVVENRLLDSDELDSLVAAVDCVVLAHSNEGPSGILGKATVTGTRIITAGAVSLASDARSHPDMMSWHVLDVASLTDAFTLTSRKQRPEKVGASSAADFAMALL